MASKSNDQPAIHLRRMKQSCFLTTKAAASRRQLTILLLCSVLLHIRYADLTSDQNAQLPHT